ncbi:hypothetical protein [Nocardia farcinica]|uniref:hypothetical protein n=1 Tax=Nocardia farcinica TaxID=37329 RepID=UPI0037A9F6BC
MSTAITKRADEDASATARTWLATTELADDEGAIARLSRAISPSQQGFATRRSLPLDSGSDHTDAILDLLRAGQVPTVEAVESLTHSVHGSRAVGERKARHERYTHCYEVLSTARHSLGEVISAEVALYWMNNGIGPLWREAWEFEAVCQWRKEQAATVPEFGLIGPNALGLLHRAGWLASNRSMRSLCPSRRFYTRYYGDHVSGAPADVVGYGVARYIGIYRRLHDKRSPSWEEMVAHTTDVKGVPLFFNVTDARAQQRWLVTSGWLRIEGGNLRRGARAKASSRRRVRPPHDAASAGSSR